MNHKILFFSLVLASVLFESFGDILFKKWALAPSWLLFAIGMALWMASGVFWVWSLKFELLTKAGMVFTIMSLAFITGAGIFYFKEELTWWNRIGLCLGLLSIILLEI